MCQLHKRLLFSAIAPPYAHAHILCQYIPGCLINFGQKNSCTKRQTRLNTEMIIELRHTSKY